MDQSVIREMREDWNRRAVEDACHHIKTQSTRQTDAEFFRSGEINVANDVLPEMFRICGGTRSPLELEILEIGCGIGRMTRMLARIFGRVTGVDISPEMIRQAHEKLSDLPNVTLLVGDGFTLSPLAAEHFDFAFSFIVFQHIPSLEVIRSYFHEVWRVLKPGSLFKEQVQGCIDVKYEKHDSWIGIPLSYEQVLKLVDVSGFVLETVTGAGSQMFWLTMRKPGRLLSERWKAKQPASLTQYSDDGISIESAGEFLAPAAHRER
jgi:SAM-dependent methyltransferase